MVNSELYSSLTRNYPLSPWSCPSGMFVILCPRHCYSWCFPKCTHLLLGVWGEERGRNAQWWTSRLAPLPPWHYPYRMTAAQDRCCCLSTKRQAVIFPRLGRGDDGEPVEKVCSICPKLESTKLLYSNPISSPAPLTTFSLPKGFLLFASQVHMLLYFLWHPQSQAGLGEGAGACPRSLTYQAPESKAILLQPF